MNSHDIKEKTLLIRGFFRTATTKFDCNYPLQTLIKLQAKFAQAVAGVFAMVGGLV